MKLTKRILSMALALMLLISVFAVCFAASKNYRVTGRVNVRSGPGTKYAAIDKLSKGTSVVKIGSKNGWAYVKYAGGRGYVSSSYLSRSSSSSSGTKIVSGSKVTQCRLNMRRNATSASTLVRTLPAGVTVKMKKKSGQWAYVSYKGASGWVKAQNLR